MIHLQIEPDFNAWRQAARRLLNAEVPPDEIYWDAQSDVLPGLGEKGCNLPAAISEKKHPVSSQFLSICRLAASHRSQERWPLMYRVLWRLTHGEPHLLDISVDSDVHQLLTMHKAVRRDCHKMTAFVRFRRIEDERGEQFIAWHRPDHLIVRLTAPFFAERFAALRWTILTPDESVSWDGKSLHFSPGVPRSQAPSPDELEGLWKTYYGSIFNPARVNLRAMRAEMPVRHWDTLPETQIISDLLLDAPRRVEEMVRRAEKTNAPNFSPAHLAPSAISLPQLRELAGKCQGCELHCRATQTVFGDGPAQARLVLVGEQPGDEEDTAGQPFIGPAGRLLNDVLLEVGIDRDAVYVTNAVKHFKWEPRGNRRIHSTPSSREVVACTPWVQAELALIRPAALVCLGATASRALLGREFQLTRQRGSPFPTRWAPWTLATWHPSALLRIADPLKNAEVRRQFAEDLRLAANVLRNSTAADNAVSQ